MATGKSFLTIHSTLKLPLEVSDVFLSYSVLKLERCDYSHEILSRAAKIAAPIARNRGWKVGRLKEFQPKNKSLYGLNVNRGREVCVRTRSDTGFLEFESVLKTLLHELVHNVHGNHSASFYALLDELEKEAETVLFRLQHGINEPARYWGDGRKLGSGSAGAVNRPYPVVRTIERGRGYKLGGATPVGISAREAAVRAALARQRIEDDHSCGTQQSQEDAEDEEGNIVQVAPLLPQPVRETVKASSLKVVVDLVDGDDDDVNQSDMQVPVSMADKQMDRTSSAPRRFEATSTSLSSSASVIVIDDDDGKEEENQNGIGTQETWTCPTCTFINDSESLMCMECLTVRPDRWQCPRCSYVNIKQHLQCLACHSVRTTCE